jgi:hypothetical protein
MKFKWKLFKKIAPGEYEGGLDPRSDHAIEDLARITVEEVKNVRESN